MTSWLQQAATIANHPASLAYRHRSNPVVIGFILIPFCTIFSFANYSTKPKDTQLNTNNRQLSHVGHGSKGNSRKNIVL